MSRVTLKFSFLGAAIFTLSASAQANPLRTRPVNFKCPANMVLFDPSGQDDILCVSRGPGLGHGSVLWFDPKTGKVRRTDHSMCGSIGGFVSC